MTRLLTDVQNVKKWNKKQISFGLHTELCCVSNNKITALTDTSSGGRLAKEFFKDVDSCFHELLQFCKSRYIFSFPVVGKMCPKT